MKTCCQPGYTYNPLDSKCHDITNAATMVDPLDCPCCRAGSVYVDQDGFFIGNDPAYPGFYGVRHQVANPSPFTGIAGTCVNIANGAWALPTGLDPNACPCCPPGMWYNNTMGQCIDAKGVHWDPIPCITCVCPDPPPPVPCDTCSPGTLPITFNFNENVKNCIDCVPEGEPNLSPFKAFIADRLIAPIINFIRR